MQRSSFDAIMRSFPEAPDAEDNTPAFRFSLRNREIYEGPWSPITDVQDVIMVLAPEGDIFIALTAIATIAEIRR